MSSAKQSSSSNLLDLFVDPENLTLCAYKELGLLCYDGQALTFVSVLPPAKDASAPVFARVSTLKFTTNPPGTSAISELIPSGDGRFIALVSERCIYIAEMNTDFWNVHIPFTSVWLENLRECYTISCEILNVNLVLSKRLHTVRKLVWLKNQNSAADISPYMLGVLYSNSIVRIYDIVASKNAPVALATFQRALLGYDPDESAKSSDGKQLGLVSEIVSFDFGPTSTYDDRPFLTVFALDSDGEVYYSVCGIKTDKISDPIGPLTFEGKDESRKSFYFNSSELLFIHQPNADELPAFAFCSDQGELFHALLCQTDPIDKLLDTNKNIYRLRVVDSMQIEDWPSKNMSVALLNNADVAGEYFVVSSTEVYLLNPTPWFRHLSLAIDNPNGTPLEIPPTEVRHFFKMLNAANDETTAITAIASLSLHEEEESAGPSSNLSLFVVFDSSPRISANFIRRRFTAAVNTLPDPSKFDRLASTNQTSKRPPIGLKAPQVASIPKLSTSGLDHDQRLNTVTQAVQNVRQQTDQMHSHATDIRQKTDHLLQRASSLDLIYEQACDRLLKIFEALHSHKQQLAALREHLPTLENRYSVVINLIQSKLYTPTDDEDAAAEKLRNTRKTCTQLLEKIQEVNSKLVDSISARKTTEPFQASTTAQKFMLTKNATELQQLDAYVKRVSNEFDSLFIGS